MPRPKSLTPRVRVHVSLRQEVYAKVLLLIHSGGYEQGFSPGAFSDFIERAVEKYISDLAVREYTNKLVNQING